MLLLLLFIIRIFSQTIEPLNNVTIYIDSIGHIKNMPYNCKVYCPPGKPACGVAKCNLTTISDCSFTDFYNIVGSTDKNPMVGIYTVPPEKACDRETLFISRLGHYRIYINSYTVVSNGLPNRHILKMNTQNTMKSIGNNSIAITFTLGYNSFKNV